MPFVNSGGVVSLQGGIGGGGPAGSGNPHGRGGGGYGGESSSGAVVGGGGGGRIREEVIDVFIKFGLPLVIEDISFWDPLLFVIEVVIALPLVSDVVITFDEMLLANDGVIVGPFIVVKPLIDVVVVFKANEQGGGGGIDSEGAPSGFLWASV